MVVGVLVFLLHPAEGLPPVVRDLHPHVHEVDPALGVGTRVELLVVVGPGRARHRLRALLPRRAAVARAVDRALAAVRLDGRVDDVRVLGRDGDADLAERALRQALLQPLPRRPAVGRAVDPRLRASAHVGGHRAVALPGRGVEHVGVPGVDGDVGDARPLPRPEDLRPRLPAVRRLEEAAVAALRPERPLRGHPDDVRLLRVHDDLRDVLRVPEAQVLPARAAVTAPVDTVAEADVPAAHVLSRADPDDVGIRGVDRHAADRVRRLPVEERRPGGASVHRLPDPAGADRHVPRARVRRGRSRCPRSGRT